MTPDEEAEEVTETGDPASKAPPDAEMPPQISEEEMAILEQQMKDLRIEDLLTQTVASVLNLSARRIVKEDEVDLEQARTGIDAVRALVPFLPEEIAGEIQEPLSQIQLLYAQRSGDPEGQAPGAGEADSGQEPSDGQSGSDGPRDSGLWTPPGS